MSKSLKKINYSITLPSVCIIMCTYNAEKYLKEQIDSIINQKNVDIRLWIRDDGSTDNTIKLLHDKYGENQNVIIEHGENLGAAQSFITAIFSCNLICDYYGFSDADDVWLLDKTEHSVSLLMQRPASELTAVVTRLQVVDQKLNHLGYSAVPVRELSFRNALVQTLASGAATLMNRAAFEKVRLARPKFVAMHDSWVYLVITAFGNFIYSEKPTLLYRQHATNVFGTNHSWRRRASQRISRLLGRQANVYFRQAEEFSRLFGSSLDARKLHDLKVYLDYKSSIFSRIKFAIFPSIIKQRAMSNLYMRLLILLGRE